MRIAEHGDWCRRACRSATADLSADQSDVASDEASPDDRTMATRPAKSEAFPDVVKTVTDAWRSRKPWSRSVFAEAESGRRSNPVRSKNQNRRLPNRIKISSTGVFANGGPGRTALPIDCEIRIPQSAIGNPQFIHGYWFPFVPT